MATVIKGMHLDERDIRLFGYLHAVKVATYDQIKRDIYPEMLVDTVCHPIHKLERNKLVEVGQSRTVLRGKRYVSLRKQAFDDFVRRGQELRLELKSDAIYHDLTLVDIRNRFLKSSKTQTYQTENEIQTWDLKYKHLNSDALVTSQLKELKLQIPLEYEGSFKKAERYEPFVKKYYEASDFPLVLFIAESPGLIEIVRRVEKKLFNWEKPKFSYKLTKELLSNDALVFENCNGATLTLS